MMSQNLRINYFTQRNPEFQHNIIQPTPTPSFFPPKSDGNLSYCNKGSRPWDLNAYRGKENPQSALASIIMYVQDRATH